MFSKMKIGKKTAEENPVTMKEEAIETTLGNDQAAADSSTGYSETEQLPDHFDDLLGDSLGGEGGGDEPPSNKGMIDQQAFHALFCVGLQTASAVTKLQSLHVDKEDEACINCTRALYETIADTPMLHFILMPQGKWMERAFAIGAFTVPMAIGVSNELAARNSGRSDNDDTPPPATSVLTGSLKDMAKEQGIA